MDFSLYHGECVVLGMIAALKICVSKGTITYAQFNDIIEVFKSYNFPLSVSGITIDRVIEVSKNDKKMDGGKIKFILLSEMGNAYIDRDVTDKDMADALVGIIE